MTDKDLLRMAHDADLTDPDLGEWMIDYGYSKEAIKKFAALVAAAEREACAKVCEEMHDHYSALKDTALLNGDVDLSNASSGEPRACEFLAAAIRQRGAA